MRPGTSLSDKGDGDNDDWLIEKPCVASWCGHISDVLSCNYTYQGVNHIMNTPVKKTYRAALWGND